MKRPSLGWMLPVAASLACLAVRCTEVAVFKDEDGKTRVAAAGPDVPPVEFGEEGPPTPTPGPYEPVYPITPPAPTPTPRPK